MQLFDMPLWVAQLFVGIIYGITPLSWTLCVICPPLLLTYFGLEVAFSIRHRRLIREAQELLEPPNLSHDFLRLVFMRAMGAGMAPADEVDAKKTVIVNGLGGPNDRPIFPEENAPVDKMLPYDDPRAVDFRTSMPLWFFGAHWTEIRADNIREWLAWSLFGTTLEQVAEHDAELKAQGGKGETRGEFMEWCLRLVSNRAGHAMAEGRNEKIKSIRLTIDPVAVKSRPLIFYLVLWVAGRYIRRRITKQGFHFGAVNRRGGLEYAVRIPPGWDPKDESTRPLVFCHGLGVGLAQYFVTLKYFCRSAWTSNRPVFIPIQPSISMDLFHPNHLRPASLTDMTEDLKAAFGDLGFTKFDLLGHSNGTIVSGWIVKAMPERVNRLALVDPVCFCLWDASVAHNFLHAEAKSGVDVFLRYAVATELGVSLTISRYFNWSTNILWPFEIPAFTDPTRTAVFLSGRDTILNAPRVRKYLRENGMRDADTPYFDRELGEWRTKEGDAKGEGGIVVAWDALHGEGLIRRMPQFDRITRWLEGDGIIPVGQEKALKET